MSIHRRTFTFASLSLLTLGRLAYAADVPVVARWTTTQKENLLFITLHLKNISKETLQVLTHRGLRPAPKLQVFEIKKDGRDVIEFDVLTSAEEKERNLRGAPKAKWKQIEVGQEMVVCEFRMQVPKPLSKAKIAITSTVVSHAGELEIAEQIVTVG